MNRRTRNGKYLADALSLVRNYRRAQPLSIVSSLSHDGQIDLEKQNVRACLSYARSDLSMTVGETATG